MNISNTDNTIDSRDIIERIAELEIELKDNYHIRIDEDLPLSFEEWLELSTEEEAEEYVKLKALSEEASGAPDWEYGEILIHRDYFEQYMDEMIEGCYELPELPSFMHIMLDYDALEQDYFSVYFDGQEFLIRC